MTTTSAGSVTIAGTAILQSPRAIDPKKGPRNVVFDANLCIVEGSLTITMALLRYFAPNDMATEIQKIAMKDYQKAFIIASITTASPASIEPFMTDFNVSDYAFIGDIYHLIPFEGDANMKTNPHITITGNVNTFDINERSFTMTPTPYAILTRSNSPFPIKAHFADSGSKKRWGNDGPKVIVGSTITIEGSIQRVTRDHSNERIFQFAQIEVTNITYLGSVHANPAGSTSNDGSPKTRKRWNWDDLDSTSHNQAGPSSSQTQTLTKRKRTDDETNSENEVEEDIKHEKPADNTPPKKSS